STRVLFAAAEAHTTGRTTDCCRIGFQIMDLLLKSEILICKIFNLPGKVLIFIYLSAHFTKCPVIYCQAKHKGDRGNYGKTNVLRRRRLFVRGLLIDTSHTTSIYPSKYCLPCSIRLPTS